VKISMRPGGSFGWLRSHAAKLNIRTMRTASARLRFVRRGASVAGKMTRSGRLASAAMADSGREEAVMRRTRRTPSMASASSRMLW